MNHQFLTFAVALVAMGVAYFSVRAGFRLATFKATVEYRKNVLGAAYLLDDKHNLNDLEARIVSLSILTLYDYGYKTALVRYALRKNAAVNSNASLPVRTEVNDVARAFAVLAMFENPFLSLRLLNRQVRQDINTKAAKTATTVARAENSVAKSLPMVDTKHHHGEPLPC